MQKNHKPSSMDVESAQWDTSYHKAKHEAERDCRKQTYIVHRIWTTAKQIPDLKQWLRVK